MYVAGAGGTSSFDLQQRFKVAKGLALEVRVDLDFVCVVWLVC